MTKQQWTKEKVIEELKRLRRDGPKHNRNLDAAARRYFGSLREALRVAGLPPRDFNTPEGVSVLQSLARELNSAKAAGDATTAALLAGELKALASVLGILAYEPAAWLSMRPEVTAGEAAADGLSDEQISSLVEARVAARRPAECGGRRLWYRDRWAGRRSPTARCSARHWGDRW